MFRSVSGREEITMACQTSSAAQVFDPIRENYDNYLLIDVGSNMVNKKFSRDLESVLQRAKDSGELFFISMTSIILFQVISIALIVRSIENSVRIDVFCSTTTLIRVSSFLRCSEDYRPLHVT